jgi:hypothetical protein
MSLEPGTPTYFRQQIRMRNFSPDVVNFITFEQGALTKKLASDQEFNDQIEIFGKDDVLGRTWWRLREEIRLMDDDAKTGQEILPMHARTGFLWVYNALSGLWFEEQFYKNNGKILKSRLPKISDEELKEIQDNFSLFDRDIIRAGLSKTNYSTRRSVGVLMDNVEKAGQIAFRHLQSQPVLFQQVMAEFRVGSNIAWNKWRTLSTQG